MKFVPEPMITAKDFRRHIRRYQQLALTQPVTIKAYGEPSLVMMSLKEYQSLKRRDREVYSIDTMTKEEAEQLLADLDASLDDLKPSNMRWKAGSLERPEPKVGGAPRRPGPWRQGPHHSGAAWAVGETAPAES